VLIKFDLSEIEHRHKRSEGSGEPEAAALVWGDFLMQERQRQVAYRALIRAWLVEAARA
jgi:hypothetical protein